MWRCDECDVEFATFSAKANHVRWKHKCPGFTAQGLEKIVEANRRTAQIRYGETEIYTETRTCVCGKTFDVIFRTNRRSYNKKFCSRHCANRRQFTEESNRKRGDTLKKTLAANPELRGCYLSNRLKNNNRFSSKAERALAEALKPLGFKRHRHVTIDDVVIDIDIVSEDGRVWIESDGEWHFRKVHSGHNFEATKLRDSLEEAEAIRRNILLIRINNQTTTIEQQVNFITETMQKGVSGRVEKFGFLPT